jgi:hypothetical protein
MSDLILMATDTQVGGRPCVRVFVSCQHEDRWHDSQYTEWELLEKRPETRGKVIDRAIAEHRENLAAQRVSCGCEVPPVRFSDR